MACLHGTRRIRRPGHGRPADSEHRLGARAVELGWRPCRFPTSKSAPSRSNRQTPTRSCWRSRSSIPIRPQRSPTGRGCARRSSPPGSPERRRRSSASTRRRARALPLAVVGTGADPDAAAVRDAVGAGIRMLTGFARVSVAVVGATPETLPRRRGGRRPGRLPLQRLQVRSAEGPGGHGDRALRRRRSSPAALAAATAAASAAALVKDLVSTPAEWLGPADFASARRRGGRRAPRRGRGAR